MVSVAVSCAILRFHCTQKQIFFPRKGEKNEKKKKEKGMLFSQRNGGRLSRFLGKILPGMKCRCGDFFKNP